MFKSFATYNLAKAKGKMQKKYYVRIGFTVD